MENSTRFSIKKIVFAALLIFGLASLSGLHAQCSISDITSSNESVCNDNGTPSNISDDSFTADISVTFSDAPLTGTLDLSGDGTASVSVVGLVSPHTFTGVTLPANGNAISLTATFSNDLACTLTDNSVVISPFECSDDACPDVIPAGNPSGALLDTEVTFDINSGINEGSPAVLNSITITGQPNPFTEIYAPNNVNYQYDNPAATSQFIRDQSVLGVNVADGPDIFDPALLNANAENDLRHYLSMDFTIVPTDYNEYIYNTAITAAANRYVVVTERNGNNIMSVQALDASLNLIGNSVSVDSGNYIDTGVETDFNQNVFVTIYPLTALVPSGTDIQGIRVTQSGAPIGGGDGGDGKAFIIYDPAFLTLPPTINVSSTFVEPDCVNPLGSITIDATDNGGGALEYSINGSAGPWQASNMFVNLPSGSYTMAVRYISNTACVEEAISPIVFEEPDICDITSANESSCNDNGTPLNFTDDFYTADITVFFNNPPATGTLDLTGDGTATVPVSSISNPSYTFMGVVLPANGSNISLTATFSADPLRTLTVNDVTLAPFECSDEDCPDAIAIGSPTAALTDSEVTFNINSGSGPTDPALLNSLTVSGQLNPFTGIYAPNNVDYQFANPLATSQFITENTVVGSNVTDGPAIFDPALLEANSNNNLRHYVSLNNTTVNTDYIDFIYNSPIAASSNRYILVTERNGNNFIGIQALDNSLNPTGAGVIVSPTDYIDTGVETDFGQNVFVAIYPLTAFVSPGSDIQGIRVTQSAAPPAGGDGGDGKVFIMYDTALYTPPPTINVTTSNVQPTCINNTGSITVDATDNGGGTIEYSVNGLAGPFQSSSNFTGLAPGSYTVAVRYDTPARYLHTRFKAVQASSVGVAIHLQTSFAPNCKSGLSSER